ncbi:MAG: MBL fold metallo-hydrolase [Clostridia bacterium]|nr:MBL fold metallo-hydrolase [Clostridia bacterium]
MRLHLLGVSGPFPEPRGACSGYLLEAGSLLLQFDLGTGVLSRLTELTAPEALNAVFLSHWHFDHTSDLLPLIYRLQASGSVLRVYAPADGSSPIRNIVLHSDCFELHDIAPGDTISTGDVHVTAGRAVHPVPAVMYKVTAKDGVFCYTGDTNLFPGLADFLRGTDTLLADALFTRALWSAEKPHLSASLAAELAADAGVSRLILTHLNPSIPVETLVREAREHFGDVQPASAGQIIDL